MNATVGDCGAIRVAEAAQRAGISPDQFRGLVDRGIIVPDAEDRFTAGHVRRFGLVEGLAAAGIPPDGLGAAIRSGQVSLDFLDEPVFERFSALSDVTFGRFAERTGAPVQLLMLIREAAGSSAPHPDDWIREEELKSWLSGRASPYARRIASASPHRGRARSGGPHAIRVFDAQCERWCDANASASVRIIDGTDRSAGSGGIGEDRALPAAGRTSPNGHYVL